MTRFRGLHSSECRDTALRSHSYKSGAGLIRVRDFHPIPLSSEEQEYVSGFQPGRAFATKAEVLFTCMGVLYRKTYAPVKPVSCRDAFLV